MLMLWDFENNRMVGLMGMGWDMGPPFWPYQAIHLLLSTINAPAFVLSIPVLKLVNLQTLSLQYGVWLPAIVGVGGGGLGLESISGLSGVGATVTRRCLPVRLPQRVLGSFTSRCVSHSTNFIGGWNMPTTLRLSVCPPFSELSVQSCGVCLLAGGCVVAAIRLFQLGTTQTEEKRPKFRLLLIGRHLLPSTSSQYMVGTRH